MDYARLSPEGPEVSRVIFGAWAIGGWMWGGTDDAKAVEAIQKAIEVGMTTIDTAPVYGFGHSEEIVGQAIKDHRDQVQIATKCGLLWDGGEGKDYFQTTDAEGHEVHVYHKLKKDSILEEIDQSLERLGVDYVDLYQCHWPDKTTQPAETMEALNQILEEGKAKAIGVSNFAPELIAAFREHGPIVSDQPLYNMLDRDIEEGLLPYCAENHVGVIVYSPLHQGLLTGAVTMDRTFGEGDQRNWKPWFKPENRKRVLEFLEKVKPIARKHRRTLAQVAVNWCLCQHGVTAALVGARNPEQVEENAGAAGWGLTRDELTRIRGWLDELGGPIG